MVRMLLAHNAKDRPSSKELISKYLPLKMEEADFTHVRVCMKVHVFCSFKQGLTVGLLKLIPNLCILCSISHVRHMGLKYSY